MLKDKRPFELENIQWDSNCRKENFYFPKQINEISKQKNVLSQNSFKFDKKIAIT